MKEITIFCYNVNGLRSCLLKGSFQKFISTHKPEIVCLSETKISSKINIITDSRFKDFRNFLSVEKYTIIYNNSSDKNGYSGTMVLTKLPPKNVFFDIPNLKEKEGRVITINFGTFLLINCYVPNSGEFLQRLPYRTKVWDKLFRDYLKSLKKSGYDNIIICGDLNCAHTIMDIYKPKGKELSPGFTVQERKNFSKLLKLGYVDIYRYLHPDVEKYTYGNINRGWRIDYFLTNHEFLKNITSVGIVDIDAENNKKSGYSSDHFSIILSCKYTKK